MSETISIQTYSCYSAFYGTGLVKEYAKQAKKLGHRALGLTDRNTLAGNIQLEKYCREQGIKPIHGYDTYLYETNSKDDKNTALCRIILYAKTEEGFRNLIRINNFVQKKHENGGGFYYRPRLNFDKLFELSEGIAVVIPVSGAKSLLKEITPRKKNYQYLLQLKSFFGDDFYIGTDQVIPELEEFQQIGAFNVVATKLSGMLAANTLPEQDDGHQKLNIMNDAAGLSLDAIPADIDPSLLETLNRFVDSIQSEIVSIGKYRKIPMNHEDPTGKLLEDVRQGWINKLDSEAEGKTLDQILNDPSNHLKYSKTLIKSDHPQAKYKTLADYALRLKEEINVFSTYDKHEYFFPIKLACEEVDRLGKFRGPGRGSGAGCLYSYLLDLTRIDPLPYDLQFSRFFSEARAKTDPPDYDADFSREGRDIAVNSMKSNFGSDRVVKIGTYSRMKTKSAIKAVARSKAYGIDDNDGKRIMYEPFILNRILDIHVTATSRGQDELDELLMEEKFLDFYNKHSNWLNTYVLPLLECITSQSIHAAGVVITPGPFEDELPLNYRNDDEGMTTQWEMADLDSAGYLKYDILVIDACDVVQDAIDLIEARHSIKLPSIEEICIDDPLTLEGFKQVLTRGIFQFNTFSQMRFLRTLMPTSFANMVASVALIRPGPISAGADKAYARRLNGEEEVEYLFDELKGILAPTYGLMIYQEQMMLIAQKLCSFTGVEAEALRKACGKKKIEEMQKWEAEFINRGVKNGHNADKLKILWDEIVGFAAYSFNKCLTGDTIVYRGGKNRFCDTIEIRIEDLYNESKANSSWGEKIRAGRQKIRMMSDDGRIRLGNIKSVVQNGVKPVFKVTLENGMSLKGTDNHRLLSTSGYKEISELVIGEELVITDISIDLQSEGVPTESSKIVSIEYYGEEMTYDIEMSNQEHNFVANGIVSHNSHSVSYTMISYYEMYLKVRYPTEYWCSTLLHSKTGNKTGNSTYDLKAEAEKENMSFIFPSATGFAEHFSVAGEGKIYWPINVVKGVGDAAIQILTDNGQRHHFDDMEDFVSHALKKNPQTNRQTVTAGTVKALVKAGFFNCWMEPWEAMEQYNLQVAKAKNKKKPDEVDYEMSRNDRVYWMTLRNSIFGCQVEQWKGSGLPFTKGIRDYSDEQLKEQPDGSYILIGGEVKDILRNRDRNGNWWARIKIQDGGYTYYVKAWSAWWENKDLDRERTRPNVGDLVEMEVKKGTYRDRADLTLTYRDQYCAIIARP